MSSPVSVWLCSGAQHAKLNFSRVQRKLPHLYRGPQSQAPSVSRGVSKHKTQKTLKQKSAKRPGRSWEGIVWKVHWGFPLRGLLNQRTCCCRCWRGFVMIPWFFLSLQTSEPSCIILVYSSFRLGPWPDPRPLKSQSHPASSCLCETFQFLTFTNTS